MMTILDCGLRNADIKILTFEFDLSHNSAPNNASQTHIFRVRVT